MNARNREMTGVSDYVCTSTFCVRRANSERDWTLLRRSIHASFRVCSCVYVNFSFMKRQQKLSLFLRQREWQRKVKIKVNWRRQMTKVEKLVQQRVNPQKLQNFQSSRRPQQVPLWENSVRPGKILIRGYSMIFEVYYYHNNLTQTIFEMTQFKMSCGTFDPLSIISRLNTDQLISLFILIHLICVAE